MLNTIVATVADIISLIFVAVFFSAYEQQNNTKREENKEKEKNTERDEKSNVKIKTAHRTTSEANAIDEKEIAMFS